MVSGNYKVTFLEVSTNFCWKILPGYPKPVPHIIQTSIMNNKRCLFLHRQFADVHLRHKSISKITGFYSITSCNEPPFQLIPSSPLRIPLNDSPEMNSTPCRIASAVNEIFSNRARNNLSMTIISTFFCCLFGTVNLFRKCVYAPSSSRNVCDPLWWVGVSAEILAVYHIHAADWVGSRSFFFFANLRRTSDFYLLFSFFFFEYSINECDIDGDWFWFVMSAAAAFFSAPLFDGRNE